MAKLSEQGAQPQKPIKWTALAVSKNFTGLYSNRSAIHDASPNIYEERYFQGRPDALLDGLNVELTEQLTLRRRYGLSEFSSYSYPTGPSNIFSFSLPNNTVQVLVDLDPTPDFSVASVEVISDVAYYTFSTSQTVAANNAFQGWVFQVAGFDQANNNGVFTCTASTANYLILTNTSAVADTAAATAISSGAVYYDQQNGSSTFLFGKQPGAGLTHFCGVAGILYGGDGVSTWQYTPLVDNGNTGSFGTPNVWNWNGPAPANQPNVITTASGSAAAIWIADTCFTTCGLLLDSNDHAQYLFGVNATGTNTSLTLGTSGTGQPNWNNAKGSTTGPDGSVTWTNFGTISLWQSNTSYPYEAAILDPQSGWIFQSSGGTTGNSRPNFVPIINTHTNESTPSGNMLWQAQGSAVGWAPGTLYNSWWEHPNCIVCQPIVPTVQNLTPVAGQTLQPIYLMGANVQAVGSNNQPGTSGSGYTPPWPGVAGQTTLDGQLQWVDLGSAIWSANTDYSAWNPGSISFSVLLDPYNDFQVCIQSGQSGSVQPYSQWQQSYTYAPGSTVAVKSGTIFILFTTSGGGTSGSTQPQWNFTPSSTTTDNTISWVASSTVVTNVWANTYGSQTHDGSAIYVNVGTSITWSPSVQFYFPIGGFNVPTTSNPYAGIDIIGAGYVQSVINSGITGSTQPNWPTSSNLNFTLTGVATAVGQTAIYSGTITNGASNAYAGNYFTISGFVTHGVNNGLFLCVASSNSTLTLVNPNAISETQAATAVGSAIGSSTLDGTVTWYTESLATTNSLSWQNGYCYAFSFYSRLNDDPYNTTVAQGGFGPPPGLTYVLGTPTGSQTGNLTTASPVFQITGSNAGAVNTLVMLGSPDPQYDTICVWRSPDQTSGSSQMYFLTEVPMVPAIQGKPQYTIFQDWLPDVATTISGVAYPGLNPELPAPINSVCNPPPSDFLPEVYNFQRIFGISSQQVQWSAGPDLVGLGNQQSAFSPSLYFPFLETPVRLIKTSQAIVCFQPSNIQVIAGGPTTISFYQVEISEGDGLATWTALAQHGSETFFLTTDGRYLSLNSSFQVADIGFPIENLIVSDFTTSNSYVASLNVAGDHGLFVTTGNNDGWYRAWLNTPQITGQGVSFSPKGTPAQGCKLLQAVNIAPGDRRLLVGSPTSGPILMRDQTRWDDSGQPYPAFFVMGAWVLANPGTLAILRAVELDLNPPQFTPNPTPQTPSVAFLLDEISSNYGTNFIYFQNQRASQTYSNGFQVETPSLTGTTLSHTSFSPNRYFFASAGPNLARCRFITLKVDFGTSNIPTELLGLTILGRLIVE